MSDHFEAQHNGILWGVLSLIPMLTLLCALPAAAVTAPPPHSEPAWVSPLDLQSLRGTIISGATFQPVVKAPKAKAAEWQAWRCGADGSVAMSFGRPLRLVSNAGDHREVEKASLLFFQNNAGEFGLKGNTPSVANIHIDAGQTTVLLQAVIQTVPVYGAYLTLNLNHHGELISLKAQGFGDRISGGWILAEKEAVARALKIVKVKSTDNSAKKVWLPVKSGPNTTLRPAYQVYLKPDDPGLRPVLFIDAASGDLLAGQNNIVYVRVNGLVTGGYKHRYEIEPDSIVGFPDELIRAGNQQTYSDLEGWFTFDVSFQQPVLFTTELRGRWVNVDYEDGPDATQQIRLAQPEDVNFLWSNRNSRGDERTLYVQTNFIHAFWKTLDPGFDALDYAVPAVCEYEENYDNAMWNGYGMYFGNGPQMGNFAYHADAVYHEYGHGVTQHLFPGALMPYRGESGALNEAWSDYFPCSITNDPWMGEVNSHGAGAFRNLENDLIYPDNIQNEVHADSRIISAAMWELRRSLGKEITDSLIHYARYRLGNDFIAHFLDILNTDDDDGDISNGTPHSTDIYRCFGRHGIGPGVIPKLTITQLSYHDDNRHGAAGNDDGLWEPGETVRIAMELFREGSFFPPPAEDVTVSLSCGDPDVEIVNAQVNFGDMYVNDRRASDAALLFRVAPDAPPKFVDFVFTVSANDGEFSFDKTARLPIGHPPILLVRDGNYGFDRTPYFQRSLDALGLTYLSYSLAAPDRPLDDRMGQFGTVIWFTGDSRDSVLEDSSIEQLQSFLDGGGNLLLTGQSAASMRNAREFFYLYLGVLNFIDSLRNFELRGVADDPVGRGYELLLLGAPGAHNQRRPGAIQPVEPAREIYYYYVAEGQPAGGVRREDPETGAKTVFLSFGLEAVSGLGYTTSREEALGAILEWFGLPINAAPKEVSLPLSFAVGAPYPNPFNGMLRLPVSVPAAGLTQVTVYDLQGRRISVSRQMLGTGANILSLNAAGWPGGLYIIELDCHGERQRQKALLMK